MNAADVMTKHVVTIGQESSVQDAAQRMLEHGVSALPVVDGEDHLVGIVSEGDLIRRIEIGTQKVRPWWLEMLAHRDRLADEFTKAHAIKVADVMTREVVSAGEEMSLGDIATLLERNGIKRLPILRNGKIVGIVSRANLLRALADAPVYRAVAEDDMSLREMVIERIRSVPGGMPWLLTVLVRDGIAELWGPIHSDEQRRAIRVAAETTPGIRKVQDNMYRMPATSM